MTINTIEKRKCSNLEELEIGLLLEGIYRYYGHDFRDYSIFTIRRRVLNRLKLEKMATITALLDRILHDPKMMEKVFYDFSINVTEMFRDPSFFKAFREKVIPNIKNCSKIRIWHAGCSTGEEVYSMAILLHEAGLLSKSRIYATDINEKVLETAKVGIFPITKYKVYSQNYVQAGGSLDFDDYLSITKDYAYFKPFLSEKMFFTQHNLVTDHSFNEFHIVICRNVLIYFNAKLQKRVKNLFYDSLGDNGYLVLGKRDGTTAMLHSIQFSMIDQKEKIYQKAKV
ncbi:CheR family methyltransferase [Cytobacillus sp. Hz8]|uniref:CheR family methyltransferase n=1 Tax=Cytobacillus sp. Hz8 TaxID=3347168 RepID=UPI0035DA49CE